MANPTRKDAEDRTKKQRTHTRKTTNNPTTTTRPKNTTSSNGKTTSTRTSTNGTSTRKSSTTKNTSGGGGLTPSGGNGAITLEGLVGKLQVLDIQGISAGDPYAVLPGVPEMSKKESLQLQTQLARQENALDVRLQRAKTARKGIKVATEEQNAVTDAVNFQSAVVGTETAVWNYHSAVGDRDIAASKYEQKQEQLIQQQNSTAHTIAMTPLMQEENELNLTKQQLKNDKLRLDIEQTRSDLALKQNELDAMVIDI